LSVREVPPVLLVRKVFKAKLALRASESNYKALWLM
jgi:hypothetical protein